MESPKQPLKRHHRARATHFACKCEEGFILPIGAMCNTCGYDGQKRKRQRNTARYDQIIKLMGQGVKKKAIIERMRTTYQTIGDALSWVLKK